MTTSKKYKISSIWSQVPIPQGILLSDDSPNHWSLAIHQEVKEVFLLWSPEEVTYDKYYVPKKLKMKIMIKKNKILEQRRAWLMKKAQNQVQEY